MTASAGSRPTPSSVMGILPPADYASSTTLNGLAGQRLFKKHKVLPHPSKGKPVGVNGSPRSLAPGYSLEIDTSPKSSGSQASISTLKHQSRKTVGGPDLPPTPPVHSRNPSSSHSTLPSSPTYVASPIQNTERVQATSPVTPTDQRTPPTPNLTPERTPPGPADRRPKLRPPIYDRMPSKTTTDSRTESFRTAPENPYSSEDEDEKSTIRPKPPSARTSQNTVRQVDVEADSGPQTVGLGLGLESGAEDDLTPRTRREFASFDGGWASGSEVEQEWDDNLMRNVTVKKRKPGMNGSKQEVVENVTITQTNATKALRSISLQESPLVYPSRRVVSDRVKLSTASSISESSTNMDPRRFSGVSTRSTISTVVEAILVDAPPQRRKTLRHVKKKAVLRDSGLDLSSTGSIPTSLASDDPRNQERPSGQAGRERIASTATFNSISSRKARREIYKNGAIPVIVIPGRSSSVKSNSKEPSLRSTSSRRSKRSQSLSSTPIPLSSKGTTPHFERPTRRSRTLSESDGSRPGDQRTIDYPPVVPARSSSLSAPTSRNTSRAGSLTAQSLEAHNALQAQQTRKALQSLSPNDPNEPQASERAAARRQPLHTNPGLVEQKHASSEIAIRLIPSFESNKSGKESHSHGAHEDGYGDPFYGRRLSVQKTPFSLASLETTVTSHAEVSEALAVNIYPHQNKSVLVVNHSNKPSESSSLEQPQTTPEQESPIIKSTEPGVTGPVTPPQPTFSMDDVDSPLRNPRAPPEPPELPEPPVITFIPATPSGLTPAQEKQERLGNYFEEAPQEPQRPISLLRRTLSLRRHSEYGPSASRNPGLLTRTFSLSRNVKKQRPENGTARGGREPASSAYPTEDDEPADENRLHPFWRPAHFDYPRDENDWVYDVSDEEMARFPPVDNRPAPRRSLSARMKRTFAILPIRDEYDDHYAPVESGVTAQRSIRRTASGSLRVVKQRRSLDSLRRQARALDERPYTAPDQETRSRGPRFWRSNSLSRRYPKGGADASIFPNFLPGLGSKIDKYGFHNLPRRISERQREKRSRELRLKISGPREVRDGVGDVIRRSSWRDAFNQSRHV